MATAQFVLSGYNTVSLTANTPLRLVAAVSGHYYMNILNLGPGTLYYKADGDPTVGDPSSLTLPPNMSDNQVDVTGTQGLGVITDQTGTIAIRAGIL
jgi:hypothetical protein